MTRQNYYAQRKRRQRQEIDGDLILTLVDQKRQLQPYLGARKARVLIQSDLDEAGITIGRDRLFALLRENDRLVERKPRSTKTTNSRHSLPVFRNLISGLVPTAPNQVWVSDLTYIDTDEGWMYAALITDLFSRKIVGAHIGDSLETEGCLSALREALRDLPEGRTPIHHSDRGCQYCSHRYVDYAQANGLTMSMTEELHCYENAVAERVNGILKGEYDLDCRFRSKEQAVIALQQAVHLYNNCRPHTSLKYDFPARVHERVA